MIPKSTKCSQLILKMKNQNLQRWDHTKKKIAIPNKNPNNNPPEAHIDEEFDKQT
jgi:hypothetical protein